MSVTTMGSRGWGSLWSQKTQEATAWPLRRLHRCLQWRVNWWWRRRARPGRGRCHCTPPHSLGAADPHTPSCFQGLEAPLGNRESALEWRTP